MAWLVLAIAVVSVIQSDWFLNGLLSFVFAGAIPGTNQVLKPEMVIAAIVGSVATVVFLWIMIALIRHISFRRWLKNHAEELQNGLVPESQVSQLSNVPSTPVAALAAQDVRPSASEIVTSIDADTPQHTPEELIESFEALAQQTEEVKTANSVAPVRQVHRITIAALLNGLLSIARGLWRLVVWLAQTVWRLLVSLGRGLAALWLAMRPWVHKLDAWLEKQWKLGLAQSKTAIVKNDDVVFAASVGRQAIVRPMSTLRENSQKPSKTVAKRARAPKAKAKAKSLLVASGKRVTTTSRKKASKKRG